MELNPAPNIPTLTLTSYGLETPGIFATNTGVPASATWPSANRALFIPFWIETLVIPTFMWIANGAVVSGNFDVGIYDIYGTRLYHSGPLIHSGTNQIQSNPVLSPPKLGVGSYYLALDFDNATAQVIRKSTNLTALRNCGCQQVSAVFPLPDKANFASINNGYWPVFGFDTYSSRVS